MPSALRSESHGAKGAMTFASLRGHRFSADTRAALEGRAAVEVDESLSWLSLWRRLRRRRRRLSGRCQHDRFLAWSIILTIISSLSFVPTRNGTYQAAMLIP